MFRGKQAEFVPDNDINTKHEHLWEIKWKDYKDAKWTTKFKKILYADKMRVEVWICVDITCNHIDVDVYRNGEKNLEDGDEFVDNIKNIDEAIIKARTNLRYEKSMFFKQNNTIEALKQRWKNVIGDKIINGNFCSNCGNGLHE